MQRNRHNHVGAPVVRCAQNDFGKPRREPVAQASHLFVFQQQDGFDQRVVVEREASRAVECEKLHAAEAAKRFSRLHGHARNEWPSAATAHRLADSLKSIQTREADWYAAGVRKRPAADTARAGEHDRYECVERAFQDHGCVVNREDTGQRYPKSGGEGRETNARKDTARA